MEQFQWWHAAILGLVEGITEYLPISSTGHLILASALMGLDHPPELKRAVDAFNIVIQGGAILAVLGLYWPAIARMIRGVLGRDNAGFALFLNLVIAFIPAGILGPLLDDWLESNLFFAGPVLAALLLGGVFMILLDQWRSGRFGLPPRSGAGLEDLTPRQALFIGAMQCVAMIPGTSRSMMTIAGGMLAGLRPVVAAEFSFLLGLPTLGGACLFKLAKNLTTAHRDGTPNLFEQLGGVNTLVGLAVATLSAALAIRWLVAFLNTHGLSVFGYYRLALCVVLGLLVWRGIVRISPPTEQNAAVARSVCPSALVASSRSDR